MVRRLLPLLFVAASSGCFDFDAAFGRFCDGGRCAADAGDAGDDGGTDAGPGLCQSFLCPELNWKSDQSSSLNSYITVAPGLMAESLANFRVMASFVQNDAWSTVNQVEYRFIDGGVVALDRSSTLGAARVVRQLKGASLKDYWFVYGAATHYEETTAAATDVFDCKLNDGGVTSPSHYGIEPVTAGEAWLVGYPMSICHWTATDGITTTVDPASHPNAYLLDVYRARSGEVFVVGGDWADPVGSCIIFREDGTQVPAPPVPDDYYGDGCSSVDGAGNAVYALARSDANGKGQILALTPDGGFESVYTAPFRLARLTVTPSGEVWAVGQAPNRAVYFDGGTWGVVTLSMTELRASVRWENVKVTTDGVILSGFEMETDGGSTAVVNTYRRQGH